jgi:RNA polymerase sigma-70 factor (ECF subfamily)
MTWQLENEQTLIAAAQQGEQAAFGHLYDYYFPKVFGRVCSLVPREAADDVTQEIFISIARSLDSFGGRSSFSTWVYRIVKRRVADFYRARSRKVEKIPLEDVPEPAAENPFNAVADQMLLQKALRSLPESHREIILLRLADGLPFQAIADHLKISLAAAKMRFYRAIEGCQETIQSLQDDVTFA